MGGRDGARESVNLGIGAAADAAPVAVDHLAHDKRHSLGLESEVGEKLFIDGLDLGGPLRVAGVGFALMQEYAGDYAVLLREAGDLDETVIRTVAVALEHALHPVGSHIAGIGFLLILHEALDLDAADGDIDDADAVIVREILEQGAPEIVCRGESVAVAAERRKRLVPLPLDAAAVLEVIGGHREIALAHSDGVLGLRPGCALHIGLAETEEDVEIGVLGHQAAGQAQSN